MSPFSLCFCSCFFLIARSITSAEFKIYLPLYTLWYNHDHKLIGVLGEIFHHGRERYVITSNSRYRQYKKNTRMLRFSRCYVGSCGGTRFRRALQAGVTGKA